MITLYKTRKLLAQQRAFREKQEEARKRRRIKDFRELAENLNKQGFYEPWYSQMQRIKRADNLQRHEINEWWWINSKIATRQYKVTRL